MSDSAFRDWMFTDSWSDYRQTRQIRELGSEISTLSSSLSRQRSEASRLRSQISELEGSLDERLIRLTRAFDAFVELSDIRETLTLFDAPALVRHRTRQLLASVGQPTDIPATLRLPADLDQDYWLSPAARALGQLLSAPGTSAGPALGTSMIPVTATSPAAGSSAGPAAGSSVSAATAAGAAADIAAAQALDPERTALLIAATTALAGRTDVAATWLPTALGQFSPRVPLTAAQRLLWQEAANGSFGPAGVAELEARLRSCVSSTDDRGGGSTDDRGGDTDDALAAALTVKPVRTTGIAVLGTDASMAAALDASRRLTALRAMVCAVPEATKGPEALGDLVRQLVDEGTAEEQPLLRRVAELRAVIEDRSVDDAAPGFQAAAGTPEKLLIDDAADPTASAVAVLARRVLADRLLAVAAALARTALVDPPAETVTTLRTGTVRITVDGPDGGDVKKAQAKAEAGYPPVVVLDPVTWALGGGGLVLAVVGFFLPGPLAVFAVLAGVGLLIAGVTRLVRRSTRRADDRALRERAGLDVPRRADQAWKELLSTRETVQRMGESAAADHEAIQAALKD